jgi:hypothetical protein
MLDLYALICTGVCLAQGKLLKTYGLWTSENLILDFILLRNEPSDVGFYT